MPPRRTPTAEIIPAVGVPPRRTPTAEIIPAVLSHSAAKRRFGFASRLL